MEYFPTDLKRAEYRAAQKSQQDTHLFKRHKASPPCRVLHGREGTKSPFPADTYTNVHTQPGKREPHHRMGSALLYKIADFVEFCNPLPALTNGQMDVIIEAQRGALPGTVPHPPAVMSRKNDR